MILFIRTQESLHLPYTLKMCTTEKNKLYEVNWYDKGYKAISKVFGIHWSTVYAIISK